MDGDTEQQHPDRSAGRRPRGLRSALGAGRLRLVRVLRAAVARGAALLRRPARRLAAAGHVGPPDTAVRPGRVAGGPAVTGARGVAWRLSAVLAGVLAAASAGGVAWRGLYQDAPANAATFRAHDLGTLALATPVLVGALVRARRGSPRAELLWAGMLAYVVHTYAYHVFGAAMNALFLAHVLVFVLAAVALGLLLAGLDARSIAGQVRQRTPVRAVAVVLGLLAGSLGTMWVYQSLRYAVTGAPPDEGLLLQPPPLGHLGYALDLTTLVPAWATAAVLLWRRHPWGHVLGTVLLTSGAVVQVDYVLAVRAQAAAGIPGATGSDPQEPPIAAAIVGAAAALLAGLRRPGPVASAAA